MSRYEQELGSRRSPSWVSRDLTDETPLNHYSSGVFFCWIPIVHNPHPSTPCLFPPLSKGRLGGVHASHSHLQYFDRTSSALYRMVNVCGNSHITRPAHCSLRQRLCKVIVKGRKVLAFPQSARSQGPPWPPVADYKSSAGLALTPSYNQKRGQMMQRHHVLASLLGAQPQADAGTHGSQPTTVCRWGGLHSPCVPAEIAAECENPHRCKHFLRDRTRSARLTRAQLALQKNAPDG